MADRTPTLAEQVREAIPDPDPALVAKVRAAERLAGDRTIEVRSNNRFPHWSLERWLLVITFACTTAATAIGSVFFLGEKWQQIEDAMKALPSMQLQMNGMQQTLDQMNQRLIRTEDKVESITPDQSPPRGGRQSQTPRFAPEWTTGGGGS